jgi:hypothetical protein
MQKGVNTQYRIGVQFAEFLLAISAIIVTYLGTEAAFSLVGLRHVRLRLHGYLPEDVRIFAQSSKTGVVPRDPRGARELSLPRSGILGLAPTVSRA